jgi:hypothetical protein
MMADLRERLGSNKETLTEIDIANSIHVTVDEVIVI